ncbi:MAG: hypothetical protein DRG83_06145, partial [Deltaproteobacteria bacterium]
SFSKCIKEKRLLTRLLLTLNQNIFYKSRKTWGKAWGWQTGHDCWIRQCIHHRDTENTEPQVCIFVCREIPTDKNILPRRGRCLFSNRYLANPRFVMPDVDPASKYELLDSGSPLRFGRNDWWNNILLMFSHVLFAFFNLLNLLRMSQLFEISLIFLHKIGTSYFGDMRVTEYYSD